jgi:hypothetical protein
MQNIQEVIQALDTIIDKSIAANSRQAYFAILYRQMTLAVQQGMHAGKFEDAARMEKLDVIFAGRYIDAWHAFSNKQSVTQSWHFTLASANQLLTVIQHLLLGINTHINLDLGIAAAATSPGESILSLQHDFDKINELIANLANDMQVKLANIWWPMKWLSQLSNGSEKAVLNFSIQKARQAAWANAVALAMLPPENQQPYIAKLDLAVQALGRKIESPGVIAQCVLAPVRWLEYKDVKKVAQLLA